MQILEDVQEWALPRKGRDDVVNADEHRALPLFGVARGFDGPRQVEELREGRDNELGGRETKFAQLRRKLRDGLLVVWIDAQLYEQWLDEACVAALVHARECPAEHSRRIAPHAVLGRCRKADEFGQESALPYTRLARDEHDLGAANTRGLEGEVEARELHPSSDERCLDVDRSSWCGALAGERVGQDRPVLALHVDRTDLAEAELSVCKPEGRLGDVDLAGRGRLLQS